MVTLLSIVIVAIVEVGAIVTACDNIKLAFRHFSIVVVMSESILLIIKES